MADEADYEVGYQRPPRHSQWKPGESGNPKGRPKQIKDIGKLLDRELSQTMRITEGGETRLLSKREVILKTLVNNALKGDPRAMRMLLSYMADQKPIEGFEPDAEDQRALREFMTQLNQVGPGDETQETTDE